MKNYNKILEAVNRGIQLALDDFDDEQVQNIKSRQIQNRDYTKEYLDLMRDTVDFNLPSGNLWYKCNLGATNPTETATWPHEWWGDFYAWGETKPKDNYDESSYKFNVLTYLNKTTMPEYTKYCHNSEDGYKGYTDNLTQLELEDDAVHIKLGQNYYIPTAEDFDELFQYTTQEYKMNYCHIKDLNGVLFIGKNDISKTMFVPCAGLRCGKSSFNPSGDMGIGFEVHLWTSSFEGDNAGRAVSIVGKQHKFIMDQFKRELKGSCEINLDEYRFCGLPLRPIYRKN